MRSRSAMLICTPVVLLAAAWLYAGPLNPPAGPITSTYKTLTEVEPRIAINATNTPGDANSLFKISQPGSYYLTGNITGEAGKHGIEIVASGVTLDLNGFDLVGVPAMGLFDGVSVTTGPFTNIAVVNGSVRGWGDEGVDLGSNNPTNCRVENVQASGNSGAGIASGTASVVVNCSAYQNGTGVIVQFGSSLLNCTAHENTNTGIFTADGSTVTNCTAFRNIGRGFSLGSSSAITGCTAFDNGLDGISCPGCTITNCTAVANAGNGILGSSGSTIVNCTAKDSTLDGIRVTSSCVISGNSCSNNGSGTGDGAGIHATGADNRIEGNKCTGADRGIDVDVAGNIIVRNTCAGSTSNWEIAIGNSVGPIVVAGTNAAAISGNGPVASTLGSTDPNANFTY